MITLIDGFNLMYKFDDLAEKMFANDLAGARQGLFQLLNHYAKLYQDKIIKGKQFFPPRFVVMLDGKKNHGLDITNERIGASEVFYSMDQSADFLIKKYVHAHSHPKSITVVSSDKGVQKSVRSLAGRILTSEEFHKIFQEAVALNENFIIESKKESDVFLNEKEISFWQKLFTEKKENK